MAALALLYVAIRVLNIDAFLTTDEPFWLGRSANFYRALSQRDFVHTYQMAHPGVLTMWAGALAYSLTFADYAHLIAQNLGHVYGIGDVLKGLGQDPLHILIAARAIKVLLQAIFFLVSLRFLHRLFGPWIMMISGLLIALDPYISGLDSLLHVDGLFAICAFAAVLAMASAAQAHPDAIAPWIIAGVLAACAWMTRATGLVLLAILVGILLAQALCLWRTRPQASIRSILETPAFGGVLWLAGAGGTSLVLLPALWVDPFGTMQQVWDWSSNAATEGHEIPIFFRGQIVHGDPGPLFYPVTLLWRLTPPVILGILGFLVLLPIAYRRGWITRKLLEALMILCAFSVLYMVAMSFGAKKFDRYILPIYPVISVLAAIGVVSISRWVAGWRHRWSRLALPVITGVLVVGQVVSLVNVLPYRLDYFNPLLGGAAEAQHSIQVGWGEGAAEAVAFIQGDAEGREVTVQTSSVRPVFSYFASENIHFDSFTLETPAGWFETDYVVIGIQESQRGLSRAHEVLQAFKPAYVVDIRDVSFFEVYTPNSLPLPDHLRAPTGCTATFGDSIRLMQIVGRGGTMDLYWMTAGEQPMELEAHVTLTAPGESGATFPAQAERWEPAAPGHMSGVTVIDPRDDGSPDLSEFSLTIQVRDVGTGAILPVSVEGHGHPGEGLMTHSECYYPE